MKKILLIVCCSLILLTGCGKSKGEKESIFYNSLEKAYVSMYSTEGAGLAVYADDKVELDNNLWYLVAVSKYNTMSKLVNTVESVYDEKLAEDIEVVIGKKYKEIDDKLYTLSTSGCAFKYQLTEDLQDNLKSEIKNVKISGSSVKFTYNGKTYKGKLDGDNYKFSDKIFDCSEEK